MRNRDQLHQHYYHTRDLADWSNYKNSRNFVKTMLRSKEKTYTHNQIYKCKGNSGALWKITQHTLPSKEISKPIFTKDIEKLADEFNDYFVTVGENTVQAVK